jgi:unsaturated rhamnogalacturonyl hydrolase
MISPADLAMTPEEALRRSAARSNTYDFGVWFWGDAIALDGLLDAAELLGDERSLDQVRGAFERWSRRPLGWADHLTPGAALLRFGELSGESWPLERAAELAAHLLSVPRSSGAPLYRPDLPEYRYTVWVDTIYHVPVFYARLGESLADTSFLDHAVTEWQSHMSLLTDARGPFLAHSWDTGMHRLHGYGWGRGAGWALYGMIETLERIPLTHPARGDLVSQTQRLASSLLEVQDHTGYWHTLLHDREAYLETSTASFFAAAFSRGLRSGVLGEEFREPASRAWLATLGRLDSAGELWGVSACTYASVANIDDVVMYHTLPTEVNVWGQGSAMRAAAEQIRSATL